MMTNQEKKQPVVLMLVDGWGLSPAWQGNAIAGAKPEFFNRAWKEYRHAIVKQRDISDDPYTNYLLISTGSSNPVERKRFYPFSELRANPTLKFTLGSLKRNNASVHFVGILSKNNKPELDQLIELMQTFRDASVIYGYVHLFVDDSFISSEELQNALDDVESGLASINFGSIATVTGIENLKSENYKEIIDSIYFGKGQHFFSLKQALVKHKNGTPAKLETALIKGETSSAISDFDAVYLFSQDNKNIREFFRTIVHKNSVSGSSSWPRFLNFYALTEFPFESSNDLKFFYENDKTECLTDLACKKGIKTLLVADRFNLNNLHFYLSRNIKDIDEVVIGTEGQKAVPSRASEVFDRSWSAIKNEKYDFFILNFNALYDLSLKGKFKEAVEEVQNIDKILAQISDEMMKQNGYLVFCSAFGGAERMVDNGKNISNNKIVRQAALPFLLISNSTKFPNNNDLMHEVFHAHADLSIISQALMKVLKI